MSRSKYDWKAELGDPPFGEGVGRTHATHPLTLALKSETKAWRAKGLSVLTRALTECEGRLDELSVLLGCSWQVAQRLVILAGLRSLAGTLRLEHGHPGPTGHGTQKRSSAA